MLFDFYLVSIDHHAAFKCDANPNASFRDITCLPDTTVMKLQWLDAFDTDCVNKLWVVRKSISWGT